MRRDPTAPADTSSMGIVHDALRRDLARSRTALTTAPYPDDPQRVAIARHLAWMMAFLHQHHESEDTGLYPLVRAKNPSAATLLDTMDADHQGILPGMAAVEEAARSYEAGPGAREQALRALDTLEDALLPHLRREEDEMMPVVSATLTQAEWDAWEQSGNIEKRSKVELAETGHWVIDGQTPERRDKMTSMVPAPLRFVLLHGFAGRYRRAAYARWQTQEFANRKLSIAGSVAATSAAPPEAVWRILADVMRIGEWSHECHTAVWLDGAQSGRVGARFRGRNRSGFLRWSRPCTIRVYDEPRELVYRTSGGATGDASEWRFVLEPSASGTRIVQSFRVVSMPWWFDRTVALVLPAHLDRRPALREDLERLAALAEREHATSSNATEPAV